MNEDEISDIIYFVDHIARSKNDPNKVEENCKRIKIMLMCLKLQPVRTVYNIDVGNVPKEDVEQYIKKLRNKYKKEDHFNDEFRTL